MTAYLKCLQHGMELASITTIEEEKGIEKALNAKHSEAVGNITSTVYCILF